MRRRNLITLGEVKSSFNFNNIKRGTILAGFAILGLNLAACGGSKGSGSSSTTPTDKPIIERVAPTYTNLNTLTDKISTGDLQNDYHVSTYDYLNLYSKSKSLTGASADLNIFLNTYINTFKMAPVWSTGTSTTGAQISDYIAGVNGAPAKFYADSISFKKTTAGTDTNYGFYANENTPVVGVNFSKDPASTDKSQVTFNVKLYKDVESFNGGTGASTLNGSFSFNPALAVNDGWTPATYTYLLTDTDEGIDTSFSVKYP